MRARYLGLALLVCVGLQPLRAGDAAFVFTHAFPTEAAEGEVNDFFAAGRAPVAFEVDPRTGVSVGYLPIDAALDATGWLMYAIERAETLEAELTVFIQNGYVPVDVSVTEGIFYFLLLASEHPVSEWRLTAEPFSRTAMVSTVAAQREAGLTLHGLSFDAGLLWYLFVRYEGQPAPEMDLVFMDNTIEHLMADSEQRAAGGATLRTFAALPNELLLVGYAR